MGQELMNPHQIADICEGRDKAIALWLGLFDQYHATTGEAGRICIGGNLGLSGARDHHRGEDSLTAAFVRSRPLDQRDPLTGKITTIEARYNFEQIATHEIDRRCWSNLMERLGFDQLLDETARREFYEGLRETPDRANLPAVVQGDYFRVRIFKNGNLHIWFERADLLQQVNLLLAEYYGEAIGDGYDTTEAEDAPQFHLTPAKDFGAFMTSPTVAAQVVELARIMKGDRVLEPSAGKAALASRAREEGGSVTCIELQPGLAHELRVIHGFTDVKEADFLTLEPRHFVPFDKVVMNPPFDRGRDCDHVRHAYQFLKPGGVLVAVMSARAEWSEDKRHKALHRLIDQCAAVYGNRKWIDLPAGSFAHAGTNVNTVILAIRKPG